MFLLFEFSKIYSRVQLWVEKTFLATKSDLNRIKQDFQG